MSRNYDNWERLVAAVLKKEQLWQLFHEQSRSPSSLSSQSSSEDGDFGSKTAAIASHSSITVHKDQSPARPISKVVHPRTNWPDNSKQQSYPLPLPPVTNAPRGRPKIPVKVGFDTPPIYIYSNSTCGV